MNKDDMTFTQRKKREEFEKKQRSTLNKCLREAGIDRKTSVFMRKYLETGEYTNKRLNHLIKKINEMVVKNSQFYKLPDDLSVFQELYVKLIRKDYWLDPQQVARFNKLKRSFLLGKLKTKEWRDGVYFLEHFDHSLSEAWRKREWDCSRGIMNG